MVPSWLVSSIGRNQPRISWEADEPGEAAPYRPVGETVSNRKCWSHVWWGEMLSVQEAGGPQVDRGHSDASAALPLISRDTWGRLLNLSVPQYSQV